MKKSRKIIFTTISALAAVLVVSAFLGGSYLENHALSAPDRETCPDSEQYVTGDPAQLPKDTISVRLAQAKAESTEWLKENATTISIQSYDNITLNARFVKNESHKYAIFMHGYRSCTYSMGPYALNFYRRGYNVLIPGQRGHGWSDGDYIDMGFHSAHDLQYWCNYLSLIDKDAQIVLFGVSMGAATVLQATALKLPAAVVCAISDCSYTSAWDMFELRLKAEYGLSSFPMMNVASFFSKCKYGFSFEEASPLEAVRHSRTPTLFIHGLADDYIPLSMMNELYKAASCKKERLLVPGGTHARSAYAHPEEYWQKVIDFSENCLQ